MCSLAVNSFMYASNTHSKDPSNTERLPNFSSSLPTGKVFDVETQQEILKQLKERAKPYTPKSYEYPERISINKRGEKLLLEGGT